MLAIAARELSDNLSVFQIINLRNAMSFILICIALQASGWQQLRTTQPGVHLVRNISQLIAQYAWIFALAALPISEVFALEFTGPVWTVIIAAVLLKEKINRYRVLTLIMGFIGVLIILRPGFRNLEPALFIVIFSALCFSVANVLTKKLVVKNSPLSIIFYMAVIQFILTGIPSWSAWVTPDIGEWIWIFIMGVVSISTHYCWAKAFSYADAMVVIPMDFLRLPLAVVMGWLLYQENLDLFVILGALVMFSGNLINIMAEKKLHAGKNS